MCRECQLQMSEGSIAATQRVDACDLCGRGDFELIGGFDRQGDPLRTLVCRHCGVVSHAVIPDDQELASYYRCCYRPEYNNEYMPSAFRFLREWKRGGRRFEILRPFCTASDRVFEVGTGMGCNLKHFELARFVVAGIEPGEGFRRFACERLQLPVEGGMLTDVAPLPRYDLVMLVQVLEHMNSPTRSLRHIRKLLNPGGRVYVEVPNLAAPHAAPAPPRPGLPAAAETFPRPPPPRQRRSGPVPARHERVTRRTVYLGFTTPRPAVAPFFRRNAVEEFLEGCSRSTAPRFGPVRSTER